MVPCRRCEACLRSRGAKWGRRAVAEWANAPRSWLGTLTFRPEQRFRRLAETRQRLEKSGAQPLDTMSRLDRFSEMHRTLGPLATNYLKALRKGRKHPVLYRGEPVECPPAVFRYMLVVEPHKDWFPHYHALLHEVGGDQPLTKRQLQALWPHGHVAWKVVEDEKAAFYAAKYLSKAVVARVRASTDYGDAGESASPCQAQPGLRAHVTTSVETKRPPADRPTNGGGSGGVSPPVCADEGGARPQGGGADLPLSRMVTDQ